MKVLLYLSGEHPTLPRAEVEGVLAGEHIEYIILEEGVGRLLLDVKAKDPGFLVRLALTKKIVEVIGGLNEKQTIKALAKKIEGKTFRVSSSDKKIERELGAQLTGEGLKVRLNDSEVEVVVDDGLAGVDIHLKRDFEDRKPQNRPYFHPTSMHPRLARTLVNLAAVAPGETILDPFCGTGGILIEAGLAGMKPVGVDVDERMVTGCQKNLDHYGLKGRIEKASALEYEGKFDAIVTDPPYGRASYAGGGDAGELAREFASVADRLLERSGRLVIVAPADTELENPRLEKLAHYDVRVHKSLTRRVNVYAMR